MHEGPVPLDSPSHGSKVVGAVVSAVDVVFGALIGEVVVGMSGQV